MKLGDFILAAHKARDEDRLVYKKDAVSIVSKDRHFNDTSIHQRTWTAFSQALEEVIPTKKIRWICNRYFEKEWNELKSSIKPLERKDVERFGVGIQSATLADLQNAQNCLNWIWNFFSKDLGSLSVKEAKKLYNKATAHGHIMDKQDARSLSGSPREFIENFNFDPFRMDEQRCNLFVGIPELVSKDPKIPRLHPYYSRLSMAVTCLFENPLEGQDPKFVIPAPGLKDGKVDYYRVYKVISKGGLTAVAFVPVSDRSYLKPILSFRCTKQAPWQEGFFKSLLNNGEKQMGKSGYEECCEELRELIQDKEFSRGKKITVLAYSQGGGYAGHFLNDVLGEYWRKIGEFIGFNFIGNDDPKTSDDSPDNRVIEGIAEKINSLPPGELAPSFTIYRNIGDWVNSIGKRHVGWGINHPNSYVRVFEWKIDDYSMPRKEPHDKEQRNHWFNLHAVRPMDSNSSYTYDLYQGSTACDPILDTYERDPTLEDIRQDYGYEVIYRTVNIIYKIGNFFARILGIKFLKKYFS